MSSGHPPAVVLLSSPQPIMINYGDGKLRAVFKPVYSDPAHPPAKQWWWKHRSCCSTPAALAALGELPLTYFKKKEEEALKLPRSASILLL